MNILMISDVYFPRVNGVSTSIATFRRSLLESGHRVCLIVPDYLRDAGDDPDIIRIPSRYLALDPEDRMLKSGAILSLEAELRTRDLDLVHIQTPFIAHRVGLQLARRLGLPAVETCHTYFEEYLYHYVSFLPRGLMKAAARHFTRAQCNRLDAVIVPSTAMQEVLKSYGVRVPLSIIPTGLDLAQFTGGSGARFRKANHITAQQPVLVFVGRVAHEKNIGFLLDVVDRLRPAWPDLLLLIAGEGPARNSLQTRVSRAGLKDNVRFVDYLPRGEPLWDCFRAGDLFVFASPTETQGLVLLEAMALGVPVVSTAVMGTRDILLPGRGCLVAEEEPRAFADRVAGLLERPAQRRQLASEARDYVSGWSAGEMAARLVTFYTQVLDNPAAAASGQPEQATRTG
jgi:glycosyltransferase involved in cell wall biosynthesis